MDISKEKEKERFFEALHGLEEMSSNEEDGRLELLIRTTSPTKSFRLPAIRKTIMHPTVTLHKVTSKHLLPSRKKKSASKKEAQALPKVNQIFSECPLLLHSQQRHCYAEKTSNRKGYRIWRHERGDIDRSCNACHCREASDFPRHPQIFEDKPTRFSRICT